MKPINIAQQIQDEVEGNIKYTFYTLRDELYSELYSDDQYVALYGVVHMNLASELK